MGAMLTPDPALVRRLALVLAPAQDGMFVRPPPTEREVAEGRRRMDAFLEHLSACDRQGIEARLKELADG